MAKRKKVAGLGNSETFPGDRLLKVTTREGKIYYNNENEGTHGLKGWEMEESRKEIS